MGMLYRDALFIIASCICAYTCICVCLYKRMDVVGCTTSCLLSCEWCEEAAGFFTVSQADEQGVVGDL